MASHFPTRRALFAGVAAAFCRNLQGAEDRSRSASVDRLLDQIIENEAKIRQIVAERTPVIETYIQEESATNPVDSQDHYFLGRMRSKAEGYISFVRRQSAPPSVTEIRTRRRLLVLKQTQVSEKTPAHVEYMPEGFAHMAVIDGASFNRKTCHFEFIRREFLGEVRCLVFDVAPIDAVEPGRFIGRIWVEDQTHFITRVNGTYQKKTGEELYFHFDCWRMNTAPGVWVPAIIYTEDEAGPVNARVRLKAQTRLWGYESKASNRLDELTSILVDSAPNVKDSAEGADPSPLDGQRRWEREAETNIIDRLERIGLIAPAGEVDEVLGTVLNNLIATNSLDIEPRCRVLLTTPFETFTIGRTVVVSRGLIDVLPDEASLALVVASVLAHIAIGNPAGKEFAFNDRTMIDDHTALERFRFARSAQEVAEASKRAVELLSNSPYRDKMAGAGLFLKALKSRSSRLPHLIRSTFGNDLACYLELPEFQAILASAPALEDSKLEQVAALPLGSRIRVQPWANQIYLAKSKPVSLLSAREKLAFEVTPVNIHLSRAVEN